MTHTDFLVSLPDHACHGVTGADATAFLHGQFCADLLSVPVGGGCLTAWCTAKGRVITTLFAFRQADGWALILPSNLLARVTQRLRMFVLRASVELHPAAADAVLLGLNQGFATTLSSALQHRLLPHPVVTMRAQRYMLGVSRVEYTEVSATPTPGTAQFSARDWAQCDVESGLPWVDAETSEKFLPQELNLEHWQGLSYTKGCYPGQEIIARLRYRGSVKRGLFRLLAPEHLQSAVAPGRRLLDATGNPVAMVLYPGSKAAQGMPALAVMDFSAPPAAVLYSEQGGAAITVIGPVASTK